MAEPQTADDRGRLGIIAGRGDLPKRLIAACREQGRDFLVIALKGQADADTVADAPHLWVRLGSAVSALPQLRAADVRQLVMAGGVRRPSFFSLLPTFSTALFFLRTGALALGDDGLLSTITRQLEIEGFRVIGVEDVLPCLLAVAGAYGAHTPDACAQSDIAIAVQAAKDLGGRDIGQGVVVRAGHVIAEEDARGTDAMLANLEAGLGGVLVKVAKPDQERRADLPTIGVATVLGAARAGLAGIAVEAGGALVVDPDAVARAADDAGLFVIGVEAAS